MTRRRRTLARPAIALAFAAVAAGLAGGCSSGLYAHSSGDLAQPGEAPSDGHYVLYQPFDPRPLREPVPLKRGDPLGFRTADTGRIVVVAGDVEWIYEDASFVWRRQD